MEQIIEEVNADKFNLQNMEKLISNDVDISDFNDFLFSNQYAPALTEKVVFNIIRFLLTTFLGINKERFMKECLLDQTT